MNSILNGNRNFSKVIHLKDCKEYYFENEDELKRY